MNDECKVDLSKERLQWEKQKLAPALEKLDRKPLPSDLPRKLLYSAEDTEHIEYSRDLGFPGHPG